MSSTLNNLHSLLVSVASLGRGMYARSTGKLPERTLQVYEFEACPFCRKVREALSELDLPYLCHPCARGSRNRQAVQQLGGKQQFPYLVDDNTGQRMYESEDIITYLYATYGPGRSGLSRSLAPLSTLRAGLASAIRHRGRRVVSSAAPPPAQALELYNFEASPYCRKVREVLHELDLDFLAHNVAHGGRQRPELVARGGKMMVPFLIDPNTGAQMYESDDIVAYLQRTYGGAAGS